MLWNWYGLPKLLPSLRVVLWDEVKKEAADKAAVDAMRLVLNSIEMDAVVVIGEGEKDEAPMLFNGEKLGTGEPPAVDIAVDPIDGTRPLANGFINSIATVAIAPRGTHV